ncbi:fibrous sheath-interacting protein 2 [Callospermophilus lateralis]|uniref:fibrous sheath-interacting protein 2 n=1 Tax=Callospermophilus lateralis TaxID=76772 RepID=UPI004053C215
MELYLRACSKAANVAATKTGSSSLAADSQQCGDGVHKTQFPGVGASQLLDLPLGVKLPVIPGSNTVFFTTNISEKLFRPSYGFNLTDPYCQLLENQYKNLHDPHLRAYYKRKDILRRLKKGGYITSNNKIVCTLKELNKYRQYLTSLKLDFERNYVREQKMIAKQLRRLQETNHLPECSEIAHFQNWLLHEGAAQSIKDQERLIRHRYLDMICRELEQLERTAEEHRLLQRDREERRQREHTRRKLNLRRKIEEEWKTKEMLLLTRIGEDVKREQRVEEQRRKYREESDRKKQVLLEKKMAYHLQKMHDTGFKEDIGKSTLENSGQDGAIYESSPKKKKTTYDDIKVVYPVPEQKSQKGLPGQTTNVIYQSLSSSKNITKKSTSIVYHQDLQDNGIELKRDGIMNKKSSITDERGGINISARGSVVSAQTSPTKGYRKTSQTFIGTPIQKEEKEINTDWSGRPTKKKSSYISESGPQGRATATGIFSSPVFSNTQQNLLQNCLQQKVTSEELNSIIQNIMTWVVATVTSILYPAITKYEERLQNNTYPVSEDSVLSSDSSSFCSTCSEEFTYGSYTSATTKTYQAEPCTFAVHTSVKRTNTPLEPPSSHVERRVVGKAFHQKGQSIASELKYNKASLMYSYPKLGSSKSDSHLLAPLETGRKKSKDATTETDGLVNVNPLFSDQKAKAVDEIKNLKNVFVNFKCHLKGETELILESIFQELMSDLTQAIPSLSSVTAEVFVDQCESDKEDLFSNVDICSVASEIVENMLEKLEIAVEKKCVEVFSQEDLSVDLKPNLTASDECFTSSNGKLSEESLPPCPLEPMCDIAEDMVHAILEKLKTLASYKKTELPLEDKTKHQKQNKTDRTHTVPQSDGREKSTPDPDKTNLSFKEEIQNLISGIFSQSNLIGYVKEAIGTILGYVQTELNNERLVASEETIVFLQLLDDIFTQLRQKPVKTGVQKRRQPRVRNISDTEEKYRLTGTSLSNGPMPRKPFPPINVPGMVLYSEDDNEEIDHIVKSVLDSSFKEEKGKPQDPISNHRFTKANTDFQSKKIRRPPTKSAAPSKVALHDWELKTELPSFSNEDILKEKPCLNKDISIFTKDQKHQIQKTSENIVKCILTEMFKDVFSASSDYLSSKTGNESSALVTEESQGLSRQEWIHKMFSVSEITAVAKEIADSVLNILHKASSCIPDITESIISSSVCQTFLDKSDSPQIVNKAPNKKPLKMWFDSEKKMKYLSSLDVDSKKPYWSRSEEGTLKNIDDISNTIIDTVFKKLKLLICPKLQKRVKPSLPKQSLLQSQLSTYTTKIVNIVLHAIQNEVEFSKKNLHLTEIDYTKPPTRKGFVSDNDKKLQYLVTDLNDDIMTSPLLTCICDMVSGRNEDQRNTFLLSDKSTSSTSYGSDHFDKQNTLSFRQDKKSFLKSLATPCAFHSIKNGKDLKENNKLQVLDSIGETLQEMLNQLACVYPNSQPSCSQQNRKKSNKKQQMATELVSDVQFISKTILEYIIAKLCGVDMDTNLASFKASSESPDIDNLSFASIIEEMAKCTSIISDIISKMMQKNNKDLTKSKAKNVVPVSSKIENSKVTHPNALKTTASDILNMVFANLEGFANGNLDTLGVNNDYSQKDRGLDWECESTSAFTDICEEPLRSTLYTQAKKVSSALLKTIQTELNMNMSDLTSIKNPSPETQMFTNIVDLILDSVSTDTFSETESEDRGIETYRYQPTYGNFLPGGADTESFIEDEAPAEKELSGERTSLREEAKTYSSKQWILERTLNKIEVKLREPHKSPIVPIIKNILNEIFQSDLINELNVLSPSQIHFSDMPHNVHESTTETSVQFMNKVIGPLVSDTDVTVVADDVVRIVFHKLYSAAMTEKNVSENSCKTVTFSANVSFHEHTYGQNSSVAVLDGNPCSLQSRLTVEKQNKVNVIEDIVQTILTNLEIFTTSKVKSLFYPQVNFTVPVTLPYPHDESTLSKALSAKDSQSDEQYSCCAVDHIKSGQSNSWCQPSLSKLNIYAKEVATKILQGIKHELDKEREGPFLTQKIVVSESIASQVVSTVLDIVSCKSKCDKHSSDKEINSDQQEGIIEKLFNKPEYRKTLQFQIQDTIEGILCDIYEKTLFQNNLSIVTPSLKSSITGKYLKPNSEIFIEDTNKNIPEFSVPKSDVILFCKDTVDIVLHNLNSVVMLGINAKDSTLAQLTFCDTFPKEEGHQSLLVVSKSEEKTECFPYLKKKKSAYADDNEIAVEGKEDTKKSIPDPCEENANSITKTIFNRLLSFATERIDSLITLALQPKAKSFVSPELENCKQDDSIFCESSQVESDVNVLKISTTKTILSEELTEHTFASYREKLGSTIHLSEASLKGYADIIASTILKLIKNDLDLEIKKMHPFPNNILFQKNVFVNEIVDSTLKILYNKSSVKEISFSSKENHNFSQLTIANEILLEHKEKEKSTTISLFTNCPVEQNQTTLEKESQKNALEKIFMRNGESKQKEKTELLSAVEDLLNNLDQRIMEVLGCLPPYNEIPTFMSNYKIKTSGITHKKIFQSHINSAANDIVESVLEKMYHIVMTSLYKNKRGEVEICDNNDTLPMKLPSFRETRQARKRNNACRYGMLQVCSSAKSQNISVLENTSLQYSPLYTGKDLVQMVLSMITQFISLHLEESFSPKDCSDELPPVRLSNSKVSPKSSPRQGLKANLKGRSKITSLPKFKTKPYLGSTVAKAKSKIKLSTGEKTSIDSWSKTFTGLPHILSTGDAKNLLESKLPTSELKMYAKDITSNILESVVKKFDREMETRAMVNTEVSPSDQIMEASKLVNTILRELYATNNYNLSYPIKLSYLDDLKPSQHDLCAGSSAKEQACFYLENVSSQLEQIFPKEGIFKKMFDKWQSESNDMENEKINLLTTAENVLTEISIKAKDLEYSLSLLNLPPLEDCESRFYNHFKEGSTRAEDTKAQINMFGREIVEILFEKLQLCFLSQMPTSDSKKNLTNRKEHISSKSNHGFPTKHILNSLPVCNMKTKDSISMGSSNQIIREIVERVINMLESFVDLQFKHISKYEFSEIVKMPIENLFQVQQRLLSKKILPKLQPLKKNSDESKPITISKENIQNTLLQVHSFHSELLTYAINIVSDMLGTIKNKLDKEISQMDPPSIPTLKENIVASEIIGTLMDQCAHFKESLIKNLPKESLFQRTENTYIVNQVELATNVKTPSSKLKENSLRNNPPQSSVPDSVFYSEEDMNTKYRVSSNLPSYVRSSVEDTIKRSESEELHSETMPSCSRSKVQYHSPRKPNFGRFDEDMKRNSSLPEGSVLQKLSQKANDSTEASLKQVMSFMEMGKSENPRVFHYETLKPVGEPNQIQTTVSPLKICLAAENIVNTVLSSYGFPNQPHTNESKETIKPFFISKQSPLSEISGQQKNTENLFRMWDKKNSCMPEENSRNPDAYKEDFSLLQKWKNKNPKIDKIITLKEFEVIAFADHELGPNEIHLIARHVTTSVITYLKNFKSRVSNEEKISPISTLSRKQYELTQPLRSIYNTSSICQFCEQLTESVICHLTSSISDVTEEGREKNKDWEIQSAAFNKIISVHSEMFENRSISIGELALSISEIIIEILSNGKIIEAEITQQMGSIKTKYIYCPEVASPDLDDFFQDLLTGVIHVISKEIGINHHLESNGRNNSLSMLRSNSGSFCSKTSIVERQISPRDWESSTHKIDQLVKNNKLSYLAKKLDRFAGSLKTNESKEVVNKVFNIVVDLFLPDEFPDEAMESGKLPRTLFSCPNNQQSNFTLSNNLGLSPKSVFLLNIVCEKLVRTLLEKCTNTVFADDGSVSSEILAEECQLLKILQSEDDGDFDYCKELMGCEQLQGDYMSDLLENLADMDQDLMSSDSMLASISHSLVKSLMDKLSHSLQQAPESPPFAKKHLKYRTREIQSTFCSKANVPELVKLRQDKNFLGFVSYDSNSLTEDLSNPSVTSSKIQAPFGKQHTVKSSLSLLNRQETKEMDRLAVSNKVLRRGMNTTSVYSATFLEEIISELFCHLSISLWEKNANITEAHLNEMNILFVNNIVNEFNNSQITVLRNAEERLYFPPTDKETLSKIVNSIYCSVIEQYELNVTCGNNLLYGDSSITKQIADSILIEILDYQLPSCHRGKLVPHLYYPLKAEIILQKLQNNLRKFTFQPRPSKSYSTRLPHSFLEDVIRRLLSQLSLPSINPSCLETKNLMSSGFNEMSTCIINKVMSAISKHKIWFTIYDNQHLATGENLEKMVDSIYSSILQRCGSLISIQKNIVSRSPIMVDQIASFIIQETIENHLQPFLSGEVWPRSKTPHDAVSNMVKQVLNEATESYGPQKPSPLGIRPDTLVGEIVTRLLSKIFSPKPNTEVELENMTHKIINSVNNHLDKAKIPIPYDNKEQSLPTTDTDIVDELVTSVYRNVLNQHGLDPDVDKESDDSTIFVENITNLIVAAISNYLFHPLFSGDLSASSYSVSMAENIVQDILSNISKSIMSNQSLPPYNTLLPYTFLEDMIRVLLSRFFPPTSSLVPNRETPKDKSRMNFNEIASNLISDIRMKISQHEIRFSKDEEVKSVYSEDDVQHLVDSVFKNILQNSDSQALVQQNITNNNDVFIDRIAGFIIKYICEQHLQPFVHGKSLSSLSDEYFDDIREQLFYTGAYSSTFVEDVVSGVLGKIFHRVVGIVQMKSVKDSEDELFDKAEKLIHFIAEEFSKAQVSIVDNAEEQLCLPPVERATVKNIIDMVYSKVLEEYEREIMPDKDFLNDIKTLAVRVTKIILTETLHFQIHSDLIANLPFKSHSKLNENVLVNRVQYDISKSRFRRQASTMYTTMLSHTHLEKIVTKLMSQISPSASSVEHTDISQSDLNNTVIKLIKEIMSIISKHAICITKHGDKKQSMISEKDIQSMVDSIYADLSHSNLYQSLAKDQKGISNIPVSKIASFIIKEIFNHHLQSFLSGDKTFFSASADQTYKQKAIVPKQRELSFVVNSAAFLEEVISELLCKILYAFTHNVLAAENPDGAKARITNIVTTLVKSIILEFTTSEILVADNLDENLCFSEQYKEMVQKTVNPIYEKLLDEYKSLIQIYRAIQSDTASFGRKIYHLLLEEIYDYQVQSLVSGELVSSSYSSPQADNIIRNVLSIITKDSSGLPSCVTVLPRSLLKDMICKLLVHIVPSTDAENELKEEEVIPDDKSMETASKLTDDIIKEIYEHEIRLAIAEENSESVQLEAIENFIDSICNNILKKSEFQAEVQKGADQKGGSFLSKIAGFIMKEIMDHHLRPFLYGEESSSSDLSGNDCASVIAKSDKKKKRHSLYSATFLEDVIVDLVNKFCPFPTITEDSNKEIPESDIVGLAIKFANSLIGEFRKSEVKVLPHAEEIFSFPPIDKETIDNISNFVYDEFIGKYGSKDIQKGDKSSIVIEMIATLTQKAISAFKIQPLFSGEWSSTFFSFLNPDNITQRVQNLPQQISMKITRCLKDQPTLSEQSQKDSSQSSDQKNVTDIDDRVAVSRKSDIQDSIISSINAIMDSNLFNLVSESAAGVANKKKENQNKLGIHTKEHSENVSKVTIPSTTVKRKEAQDPHVNKKLKDNEIEKKKSTAKNEQQGARVDTQFSVATDNKEYDNYVHGSDCKIDNEKKIDSTRGSPIEKVDKHFQASPFKPKARNMETITDKTSKIIQKPSNKETRNPSAHIHVDEIPYSGYESVQNVIENIYENVLEISSSQEPLDLSKPIYRKSSPGDKALNIVQVVGNDSAQSVKKGLSPSINEKVLDKEKEKKEGEKVKEGEKEKENEKKRERECARQKNTEINPSKPDHPQHLPRNKPAVFPANFLEDVISEIVNILVFSSSPEPQICDKCLKANDDQYQAELYETAMKLIDSLLKEFSDAKIKVFRPHKGNQFLPHADKISSDSTGLPKCKEPTTDEASSSIKAKSVDKVSHMHKMTEEALSDKLLSLEKSQSIDKTLVNKVVHSSVCNILKENRSQESICKKINSNRENLARSVTSAVIDEIFQHHLNLIFCGDVPNSACFPLESKEVVKKVQKVVQTASKECQTSSPYTIMLPHRFLEDVISALLSKIFNFQSISNSKNKAKSPEGKKSTELDFLQMKLVNTVAEEISRNENMVVKYVESLHPNDDEIIQLVVQSIYNNLLPQFGTREVIQNCVASGCRLLLETIVDLVLREVAGNQLQNYFCGELTPHQCAEVDSTVENILKDIIQTASPQSSQAHKLSYNVIEEIAIKFLSKLFSVFPKGGKEITKSLENEMQNITLKILKSFQEFISKSKIKLVSPTKESPTVPLADNASIENIVNSVYDNVLKHSGSHTSVFKDLMGKSNVLSDIIGFLMVKEISNSEFQLQGGEEVSSSELALEAVQIMEKVVKIIDELKSQEKSSSRKGSVLHAKVLEEALALFLAKLLRLPSASSKDTNNLTKPELSKIASQLTKNVTAEISKSSISLVAADSEEQSLEPESMEMISQVIDSVYSNVFQQSETNKEFYDTKDTSIVFPKNVASLIIDGVSSVSSESINTKNSNSHFCGELDVNRIVDKAQNHVLKIMPELDNEEPDEENSTIKIVPYLGKKPIKIDPEIVSEHLTVLSVKTQPLEKLKMECIRRTGHSIAELRRASISGKSYSSTEPTDSEKRQKERRTTLSKTGRIDIKPLEAVCRHSFQNIKKPDITTVELLKDVQTSKDLIIRLVAHDINQEHPGHDVTEEVISDEDEIVLGEVAVQRSLGELSEDQEKEFGMTVESKVASSKTIISASNLKKILSISKCCQTTNAVNTESIETTSNLILESHDTQVQRTAAEIDMPFSKTLTETDSSPQKKTQHKKEEKTLVTEPAHYFIHRIMSTSSYNQDLISNTSEGEDYNPYPSAKVLQASSQEQKPENSSSIKFINIFEGSKNSAGKAYPSKEVIAETLKSSIPKQGSKMLAKVSSALSKVFSRSNSNIPKSSSPPHQDEH